MRAFFILCLLAMPALANEPASKPPAKAVVPCVHKFKRVPDIDDYYPKKAFDEDREGVTMLEFTLPASPSAPIEIIVIKSSGHADIDDAAIEALSDSKAETNCPGRRFRAAIKFSITR